MKKFFHILIIGAADNSNEIEIKGQLPLAQNVLEFEQKHPDYQIYLYCIDPNHFISKNDQQIFASYDEAKIAYVMILRNFSFKSFHQEYKILPEDKAFFIDFANITRSEFDWFSNLGKKWIYYTPGCAGERLDLLKDYTKAQSIPFYTIYDNIPIPSLSQAYRESLLAELNKLIVYARHAGNPPEWLLKDEMIKDTDFDTRLQIQISSHQVLDNFFKVNNQSLEDINKAYSICVKLVNKVL
jgi:hypothetical protein